MPDDLGPTGRTMFCDDLRIEQSGQYSLVGVYPGAMQISTGFPATLPKFYFCTIFDEPRELAEKRDFSAIVRIYLPGETEPAFKGEMPPPSREVLSNLWTDHLPFHKLVGEEAEANLTTNINVMLAPMVILREGLMRVRISYDDKIIRCGSLKVIDLPTRTN
jgi:hypothetical protein